MTLTAPIPTKCWKAFLKAHNCKYARDRASHEIWKCPGCKRSIVFWGNKKEVPYIHVKTDLMTMGISVADFHKWKDENC